MKYIFRTYNYKTYYYLDFIVLFFIFYENIYLHEYPQISYDFDYLKIILIIIN